MIKNKPSLVAAVALIGLLGASSASALTFTATGTGPITAYFLGETAGYGSDIGMWVNGVARNLYGLQNHTAGDGESFVLGTANAGDTLVFELRVSPNNFFGPPPISDVAYSVYSDPALNILDGNFEHAVASAFTAGTFGIPNGTLVGFEDLLGGGDRDFDDHQFVFTGVTVQNAPDGGMTIAMLGMALGGLGLLRRKF